MEELFAAILEEIVEADLIAEGALLISADILSEIAFDTAVLEEVFSGVIESLEVFKGWMVTTFQLSADVVNAMLGLQLIYHMIYTHYERASQSGRLISVSTALEDVEGTLKKNHERLVAMAKKQMAADSFAKLPPDIQSRIEAVAAETPMEYWLSNKIQIMKSLMKIPLYTH